jgi:hypothetical protein
VARTIAQTLMKIISFLDEHTPSEQGQAMAFLKARYPCGGSEADREYERARKDEYRNRDEAVLSLDVPWDMSQGPNGVSPTPVVRSTGSKVSSSKVRKALDQAALDKAKALLDAGDYEFLHACPEPFRTQWLLDPDWWVSLRDGYPRITAQREASKCMSFVQAKFKPGQLERLNLRERLRRWFAKADMWRQSAEERKAVRG